MDNQPLTILSSQFGLGEGIHSPLLSLSPGRRKNMGRGNCEVSLGPYSPGWLKVPTGLLVALGGRCRYVEQIYGGEMVEKVKQNGSCAVERGGTEEAKAVRSGLMWVGCLPPRARVMSGPRLLPRAMSESMVIPQPRSVLTS